MEELASCAASDDAGSQSGVTFFCISISGWERKENKNNCLKGKIVF